MRNRFGHRNGSPNRGNFKFVGRSNQLSSNPYEALATQSLQDKSITRPLNWRIILISIVICFGVGCVVGIGFGIIAIAHAFTLGSSITTYIGSYRRTFIVFQRDSVRVKCIELYFRNTTIQRATWSFALKRERVALSYCQTTYELKRFTPR